MVEGSSEQGSSFVDSLRGTKSMFVGNLNTMLRASELKDLIEKQGFPVKHVGLYWSFSTLFRCGYLLGGVVFP